MHKEIIKIGSLLGAITVILGAFAAHGLKGILSEYGMSVYETGVKYQFYHTIAIILCGIIYREINTRYIIIAARLFMAGIIIFSGSLYMLALNETVKWLGAITPFGGLCFISGWLMLLVATFKKN